MKNKLVLGIDLGTTNSCISIWRNNRSEIIPDKMGRHTIPSVVSFTNNSIYVGHKADRQRKLNPDNTYHDIKRLLGRSINDNIVRDDMEYISYNLCNDDKDNILIKCELNKRKSIYKLEEIVSFILMELKRMASQYLGDEMTNKVVITVPAYFNDKQRQSTKDAALIAGLECIRIINEPTAAALAYGLETLSLNNNKEMNILVYDLGGGTLDVSILTIYNGVFEVLCSTGNTHLGGEDFDNRIIKYCLDEFKKTNNITEIKELSSISLQELRKQCVNVKKILSIEDSGNIIVNNFYMNKSLYIKITKEKFESICNDLFLLCLRPVENAIESCDLEKGEIDNIILVGGSTRIPKISDMLELYLNKKISDTVNPDEVVSVGASIQGHLIENKDDPFTSSIVLLDVTALSLGVETIGGVMDIIVERNSTIPIKKSKRYTTDSDYVESVDIKVYEGERKLTKDNIMIGEFELNNIKKAPRGVAEIEVIFNIDVNGIINIKAKDLKNKNIKRIRIKNKNRMSREEINKLIEEAKKYELLDKENKERMVLIYEIDDLCCNIIDNVNKDNIKLGEEDCKKIKCEISNLQNKLVSMDDINEYLKILDLLKSKYSILILKSNVSDNNIRGIENMKIESTNIYDSDDDDNIEYKKIEETFIKDDRLKTILINLCYSVYDVLNDKEVKKQSDIYNNMKDYLDDTLLWIYVSDNLVDKDYKNKIKEVNKKCDIMMEELDNLKSKFSNSNELYHLCISLKEGIDTNIFNIKNKDKQGGIYNYINDTLKWLNNTSDTEIDESLYIKKMDHINNICNEVYKNEVKL